MKFMTTLSVTLGSILFLLFFPNSQNPATPTTPKLQGEREIHIIFTDSSGHSIENVEQGEIQVFESGKPQTITSYSLKELPTRYGLLIDNSASLRTQFRTILELARNIVNANGTEDETFIVRFVDSSAIELVQDVTSDKSQLLTGINGLRFQPGQTALLDAVYEATAKFGELGEGSTRRDALIVVSDGEDRDSYYSEDQVIKLLKKANFRIFFIGLIQELDKQEGLLRLSSRELATKLIEKLVKATDGRAFFPRDAQDFSDVLSEITHDLHKQFVLTYQLPNEATKKKKPGIEIKLSESKDTKKRQAIFKVLA